MRNLFGAACLYRMAQRLASCHKNNMRTENAAPEASNDNDTPDAFVCSSSWNAFDADMDHTSVHDEAAPPCHWCARAIRRFEVRA